MSDPVSTRPNAATAWMYRMVPKLPKGMRPKNIIILHHTGRRSGQIRTAGLQQIYHDSNTDRYFVATAYGPTSDWWLNVLAHPQVTIDVRGDVINATAAPVDPDEAVTVMDAAIEQAPRLRDQASSTPRSRSRIPTG